MKLTQSVLVAALAFGISGVSMAATHQEKVDAAGQAKISMSKAIETAESKTAGKVTSIELDRDNNVWSYEVTTVKPNVENELRIDANTGTVISQKEEKK